MAQTISPAHVVTETMQQVFAGDVSVLDKHPGMASLRKTFPAFKAAFPDLKAELQQQFTDGDCVATHWLFTGTHRGEFHGIPPTGKPIRCQNISICRVEGDRITQYNSEVGWLAVFTQIGLLPAKDGAVAGSNRPSAAVGPDRLLALSSGFWVSQILSAAAHHNFFSLIAAGQTTADAVASTAGTDATGTRMVLDSLVSIGVLTKSNDSYGLSAEAEHFLLPGRPGDLSEFVDEHLPLAWNQWGQLRDELAHRTPVRQFEQLDQAGQFFPKLIRAIMPLALAPADATAEHLGIGTTRKGLRVLDIGAGSAAWSIPFVQRDPTASVTAFDIPQVLEETRKIVQDFGVADRYRMQPGDLQHDDFGHAQYDLVVLGNICHGITPDQNRDLLKRAHRALAPGGQLLIADMVPNEERTGPPFPVMFAVNMYVMGGGDTYTLSQYKEWLRSAGYSDVTTFDTARSHSPVIIATK